MAITAVRQQLCPLVENIDALPEGKIGITVDGHVAAYIISAKRLSALEARMSGKPRRTSLRGSVQLVSDLEQGSREAAQLLEHLATRSWEQQSQ